MNKSNLTESVDRDAACISNYEDRTFDIKLTISNFSKGSSVFKKHEKFGKTEFSSILFAIFLTDRLIELKMITLNGSSIK